MAVVCPVLQVELAVMGALVNSTAEAAVAGQRREFADAGAGGLGTGGKGGEGGSATGGNSGPVTIVTELSVDGSVEVMTRGGDEQRVAPVAMGALD